MKTRSGAIAARLSVVGPVLKPPSSATSRGESPSRSSSATVVGSSVSSVGFPGAEAGGRMNPRAPRLVLGVTSASWVT
jgi:hypothetical protein